MPLPVTFGTLAQGNQPLSLLDQQFSAVSLGLNIACSATGQNNIVITPLPGQPDFAQYSNFQPKYIFYAPQTTSGAVTIQVAGLAALPAYGSNGGVALGSGDLSTFNVYEAVYWSHLNSGNGGFVVNAQTPVTSQGTWVPTVFGSSVAGAPVYSSQSGSYEQIGRQVTARFYIQTTALTSISGLLRVGGLPFPCSDVGFANISVFSGWAKASYACLGGQIDNASSYIRLIAVGQGQAAADANAGEFSASSIIAGFASYHV